MSREIILRGNSMSKNTGTATELSIDKIEVANELDSTCGISDEELTQRFKEAIRIDKEVCRIKGLPTAEFDREKRMPYILYPDGKKEYV